MSKYDQMVNDVNPFDGGSEPILNQDSIAKYGTNYPKPKRQPPPTDFTNGGNDRQDPSSSRPSSYGGATGGGGGHSGGNDSGGKNNPFSADVKKVVSKEPITEDEQIFLRRVLFALACQWSAIAIFVMIFYWLDAAESWAKSKWWILFLSGAGTGGCLGAFIYLERIRRNFGLFLAWSLVFTVCLGMNLGVLVSLAPWLSAVLYGTLMTAGVWVVQTLYAYQAKYKYTPFRGFLLTTIMVVLVTMVLGFAISWLPVILGAVMALFTSYSMYIYALKLIDTTTATTASTSGTA